MATPKRKKNKERRSKTSHVTATSKKGREGAAPKRARKRKRSSTALQVETEEQWVPPANSQCRYDAIEMNLIRWGLAMNHSCVLSDALRRWALCPGPCPIPPPSPPKDPVRAQLVALAEHRRRLGRAAGDEGQRSNMPETLAAGASAETKKKEAEVKEKDAGLPIVGTVENPEEDAAPGAGRESKVGPCEALREPCRRLFTAFCRPCPEHTPGLPRAPNKVCTCIMTPRPESRKDALRFLSLMPRELGATFSSLDPARLEEERQRKKAEARWSRRLADQWESFEGAVRGARGLLEARHSSPKPPFVSQRSSLAAARALSAIHLDFVCEARVCKM